MSDMVKVHQLEVCPNGMNTLPCVFKTKKCDQTFQTFEPVSVNALYICRHHPHKVSKDVLETVSKLKRIVQNR